MNTFLRRPSGVRKYLDRSIRSRIRQWWIKRQIAACGDDVFIDKNVFFLRHPENVSLGAHVIIKEGARICPTHPQATIRIGDSTTIGYNTFLFATSEISVGADCLVAPFCYLVDANHGIRKELLIREQDLSAAPIRINDDVWIGTSAVILKGVTIGRGAVVGANAVVSVDIPEYAIVAGNPAVIIDYRR